MPWRPVILFILSTEEIFSIGSSFLTIDLAGFFQETNISVTVRTRGIDAEKGDTRVGDELHFVVDMHPLLTRLPLVPYRAGVSGDGERCA